MIHRRQLLVGTLAAGTAFAAPASACRAPAAKDRAGSALVIDRLFQAWWERNLVAFQRPFQHPERATRFDVRGLFNSRFVQPESRFRGELLFNGGTVVVQVVMPREADVLHGICGRYAAADLFLVQFLPGFETPVVDAVRYVGSNLLAESEWAIGRHQ